MSHTIDLTPQPAAASLCVTPLWPAGHLPLKGGDQLPQRANAEFAHIHARMPVVIRREDFSRWLDCRGQEPRDVVDLLRPAEPGFFEAIPVSEKVNKFSNTGPEIQERLELEALPEEAPVRDPIAEQLMLF